MQLLDHIQIEDSSIESLTEDTPETVLNRLRFTGA